MVKKHHCNFPRVDLLCLCVNITELTLLPASLSSRESFQEVTDSLKKSAYRCDGVAGVVLFLPVESWDLSCCVGVSVW